MSPSSTCNPGQVVSRSPFRLPLVPQLLGVPPQLPLAVTVTVCAAAGAAANAASVRTRAASEAPKHVASGERDLAVVPPRASAKTNASSAARTRAANPPRVRSRRLPLPCADFSGGGGGGGSFFHEG